MTNILETFQKINEFENFPQGWNFGEGSAACAVSSLNSQELLRFAFDLGHREAEVFPGIDGEIQICFYDEDDNVLELTCEITGSVTISVEKEDELVFRKIGASLRYAIKILKDFTYNKCLSYVSSTSNTTIVTEKSDYPVWLSNPQPQIMVSRWLIRDVLKKQVQQYVTISEDIIPILPDNQLCFGKFPMSEYHLPAVIAKA